MISVRISIMIMAFLSVQNALAQSELQNVTAFCKVWGFLKYHHPLIADGKLDWDREFLSRIEEASKLNSHEEVNSFYLAWIENIGRVKECRNCNPETSDNKITRVDTLWMEKLGFSEILVERLKFIYRNRHKGVNRYASYKRVFFIDAASPNYSNENNFADSVYPSHHMRLLTLSRYWNIINYFYPYKNLTSPLWDSVLVSMIPRFKYSKDTLDYHLAIAELNASIHDSHSPVFWTPYTLKFFGNKSPIFKYILINDTAIVTGFYNDSLAKKSGLEYGDVVLEVGGKSLKSLIQEKSRIVGASNLDCLSRDLRYFLLNGVEDSVQITISRGESTKKTVIYRYSFDDPLLHEIKQDSFQAFRMINDSVAFVDLARLKTSDVNNVMSGLLKTKAIIFDIRNYPQNVYSKISSYLNRERKAFARMEVPQKGFPGVYVREKTLFVGRTNENYYRGKVILLIDANTQSMAELTVMALLTAPNVTSIGSHTAGTNGDVMSIPLPGAYQTAMSSVGVYFPDGRQTQRVGIKPDIFVRPTVKGIRGKRDEVFERAIHYINTGKH